MSAITIPIEIELSQRSRAVMEALSLVLGPQFVSTDEQTAADTIHQPLSAPVAQGAWWPEHDAWYAGLQMTPGGRFWHVLVPKAHIDALKDVKWGNYGTLIEGANDAYDGLANTATMAAAGLDLPQRLRELGDELYLPSRAEAMLMFTTLKSQIGDGLLWTSTQFSASHAWRQNFDDGYQDAYYKDCEFRAVPVRRLFL